MTRKFGSVFGAIATLAVLVVPGRALAHEPRLVSDDDQCEFHESDHGHGRHLGRYKRHHEPDADDYPIVCDEDGDDCRPNSYFNGRYSYPSQHGNPARYQYSNLAHQRLQLINNDRWLTAQYEAARARGDKKAQKSRSSHPMVSDQRWR